ncbi:unnamed protein product [Phytophthora fragariaefolia]|uniref:Unnamed protein product n=1 Tax=Phytophthora fragariaefolia TaxID=1490495 RepID=A0A9W7D006_9STRA|nr:unnamed protein product [Phytophthora fragariaefolia]
MSATKTARGTAKSGKSAKSADPPTPASGQSASASDSSVVLGLHPDLNPTSLADELALGYQHWQKYSHERKRRSDALRSVLTELYGTLYKAVNEFDAASNTPAPQLDSELYFDPSVPFAPPANLLWFPTSADWCETAVDVDVGEPWQAWWLRMPEIHTYNMYFRPRHPGFPVFGSAESDLSHVPRLVDEDVDLAESAPPTCSPSAPTPANSEGLAIFGSSEASPDVTL